MAQKRIFIAEDEPLIAMVLEDILDELGYALAASAATFAQAEQMMATTGFDAAILDADLGGQESFPLADHLRSAGIPVLFATGRGRGNLPERFRESIVIEKPYVLNCVARALERVFI